MSSEKAIIVFFLVVFFFTLSTFIGMWEQATYEDIDVTGETTYGSGSLNFFPAVIQGYSSLPIAINLIIFGSLGIMIAWLIFGSLPTMNG